MLTIVVYKDKTVRSTYVYHGVRNDQGGYFGTADAGWSYKAAIAYELGRIPRGEPYQIEVNGKVQ